MNRASIPEKVESSISDFLNSLDAADQVALASFDNQVELISDWSPVSDSSIKLDLSQLLSQSQNFHGSTILGQSLTQAASLVGDKIIETTDETTVTDGSVVIVSDFQRGSNLDGIQGFEWHEAVSVQFINAADDAPANSGLTLLGSDAPGTLRLQVLNDEESLKNQFQIDVKDGTQSSSPLLKSFQMPVSSGGSRILSIPLEDIESTRGVAQFSSGDDVPFDDQIYWVNATKGIYQFDTLNLGEPDNARSLAFYLQRAFGDSGSSFIKINPIEKVEDLKSESRFLILSSVESSSDFADLSKALRNGTDMLWIPDNANELDSIIRDVLSLSSDANGSISQLVKPRKMELIADLDWDHPLFSPFDDPQFNNFSNLGFYEYLSIPTPVLESSKARVLASFADESPWICEWKVGDGTLWVMTSGWKPEQSLLARSSKFIPILLATSQLAGAWYSTIPQYFVNQEWAPFSDDVTLKLPDGSNVDLPAGNRYSGLDQPGLVEIQSPGDSYFIPVNLDPRESLCSSTALSQLENFEIPLWELVSSSEKEDESQEMSITQMDVDMEKTQKNWKWIVALVLCLTVFETWLAGSNTRNSPQTQ